MKVFRAFSDTIRPRIIQFYMPTYRLRISVYSLLGFFWRPTVFD